jgi:release factor glutamine methyltransferase
VLAANAPYVPTDRIALMPPEARDHEPARALDGGPDGVDLHRRIAAGAPAWLAPGGVLLVETSPAQAPLTTAAMRDAGLSARVETDDGLGGCVAVGTAGGVRPGERA